MYKMYKMHWMQAILPQHMDQTFINRTSGYLIMLN